MSQSRSSFTYERDFSQAGIGRRVYETRPQLPVAYADHIREIETIRQTSFNAGLEKGKIEQSQSSENNLVNSLEQMSLHFAAYAKGLQSIETHSRETAISFALLFAKKLAGRMVEALPLDAIEDAARAVFEDMRGAPHVALRVHPTLVDACKERIEDALKNKGIDCKLIVFPDPDVAVGNCRIEWADGGIVRDQEALVAQIDQAVSSLLINQVKTPQSMLFG